MNFRLSAKLVAVKGPRILNKACGAARKNYELVFQPFNVPYGFGAGASQAVAVFSIPITVPWTIRYPVRPPSGSFVAVAAFRSGTSVRRYKLWSGVGESLAVPTYVGESLPPGAAIEIWSVPDQSAVLGFQWKLPIGLLQLPTTPCDQDGDDISATICQPTYPAPNLTALFTSCAS